MEPTLAVMSDLHVGRNDESANVAKLEAEAMVSNC
jgi:hypothetical protein